MIPLHKLSPEMQKSVLTLMVLYGGANLTGCCAPLVCDPAPPPRTATPFPRLSPIICDPAPPPSVQPTQARPVSPASVATPDFLRTPIICDPPPRPATAGPAVTATPIASRRFQLRNLQMTTDSTLTGAVVRGVIYDRQSRPFSGVLVAMQAGVTRIETTSASDGSFLIRVASPGSYQLLVGTDSSSALPLELKRFDVAAVEIREIEPVPLSSLPLAEIRVVDIVWGDDLTFNAETAWPDAQYRWSVTGGKLIESAGFVTWQPPGESGRYLLQLVADWGVSGLAIDSLELAVSAEGYVLVG
jgi:hypothetical protein